MTEKINKTRIGGQAVIEGVMMRGISSAATAVRGADGKILVAGEYVTTSPAAKKIKKIPIVRGVYNFVMSMKYGIGTLNKSAENFGTDSGEPTKFEAWLAKVFKKDISDIVTVFALIFGLAFAVGLFIILPQFIMQLFKFQLQGFLDNFVKNLMAGAIRIVIFLLYLLLISRMNDIKRVFAYHGAEHKVINCFEYALPLTVENAAKMTVRHERCGTTFIFIVMFVSVLFFSFFKFETNVFLRIASRIALLPVVAGISYEVLIFSAKHDNIFFRILRAPGMWLQKLTTREPDDSMLEVSLAAFKTVLAMDASADKSFPPSNFTNTVYPYAYARDIISERMKDYPSDETDWIMCTALKCGRASLPVTVYVRLNEFEEMKKFAEKRSTGMPLQQVFGYTEFYGYKIAVDGVLIPRPETELLVGEAKKYIETLPAGEKIKVLDLCTGSGAIAVALGCLCGGRLDITASDISPDALATARKNAENNGAEISFVMSDMFENLSGTFDIIVSNPPYIKTADIANLDTEVKDFEPLAALDGGADGLDFYRKIRAVASEYLTDGGKIFLEAGAGQSRDIESLFDGYQTVFVKDYGGIERIAVISAIK
ncbi:MAG: peptide chain release factor N(5)-glutamine methyltransferase [Clostridiales bacterium]|nr:peptide chain release factor N(5)-glutamine methyltransferase [Clostridiales bacterium]